jgi:hypothetical protein
MSISKALARWQTKKTESWLLEHIDSAVVVGTYWDAEYLRVDEWCVGHLIDCSEENVCYYGWYNDLDGQYGLTLWERADRTLTKRSKRALV